MNRLYAQTSRKDIESEHSCVGKRLVAIRKRAGLSQGDFAQSLGISPRSYSNYERGDRAIPSSLFVALWATYQVDPIWLMAGIGSLSPSTRSDSLDAKALEGVLRSLRRHLDITCKQLDIALEAKVIRYLYATAPDPRELSDAYIADTVDLVLAASGDSLGNHTPKP